MNVRITENTHKKRPLVFNPPGKWGGLGKWGWGGRVGVGVGQWGWGEAEILGICSI